MDFYGLGSRHPNIWFTPVEYPEVAYARTFESLLISIGQVMSFLNFDKKYLALKFITLKVSMIFTSLSDSSKFS